MHTRAAEFAVVARTEPARGLLDLRKRPLEVAAGKDDAARVAHLDHLVDVRQTCPDRLVGGHPLDTGLGAGDHRLLDVLPRQHDRRDVGHDLPVHRRGIRVEGLDAETRTDGLEPLRVDFSDGYQLGIRQCLVHLREVLAEAPAAYDPNGVCSLRHESLLRIEEYRTRPTSASSSLLLENDHGPSSHTWDSNRRIIPLGGEAKLLPARR